MSPRARKGAKRRGAFEDGFVFESTRALLRGGVVCSLCMSCSTATMVKTVEYMHKRSARLSKISIERLRESTRGRVLRNMVRAQDGEGI